MLLESVTVHVPAQRERDADLAEFEGLSLKVRAGFGRAACEVGDVDHPFNDPRTSALDTIANVLHWLAEESPADVEDGGAAEVVASALSMFADEASS